MNGTITLPRERFTPAGSNRVTKKTDAQAKTGRPAKEPTTTIRVRVSTAEAVERLAGIANQSTADFIAEHLDPVLVELARKIPERAKERAREILSLLDRD